MPRLACPLSEWNLIGTSTPLRVLTSFWHLVWGEILLPSFFESPVGGGWRPGEQAALWGGEEEAFRPAALCGGRGEKVEWKVGAGGRKPLDLLRWEGQGVFRPAALGLLSGFPLCRDSVSIHRNPWESNHQPQPTVVLKSPVSYQGIGVGPGSPPGQVCGLEPII